MQRSRSCGPNRPAGVTHGHRRHDVAELIADRGADGADADVQPLVVVGHVFFGATRSSSRARAAGSVTVRRRVLAAAGPALRRAPGAAEGGEDLAVHGGQVADDAARRELALERARCVEDAHAHGDAVHPSRERDRLAGDVAQRLEERARVLDELGVVAGDVGQGEGRGTEVVLVGRRVAHEESVASSVRTMR